MLDENVVIPVPENQISNIQGFYSTVFLVRKPTGKFRLILNLKALNPFVSYQRFRMESIYSVRTLLTQNCIMTNIDLRDAYWHIPIRGSSQKFLRFAIKEKRMIQHFQFRVLPFGISSAPRIFSKVMAEVTKFFHMEGILVIPYLDDLLVVAESYQKSKENTERVLEQLQTLGWIVNWDKSVLQPTSKIQFLGVIIDSETERMYLPVEKIGKLKAMIQELITKPVMTIRQVMKVLGFLTSTAPAIQWAMMHTRHLQNWMLRVWNKTQDNLETQVICPPDVLKSLEWWLSEKILTEGRMWIIPTGKIITTDASLIGWGAHLQGRMLQGQWPKCVRMQSSNYRELAAIQKALEQCTDTDGSSCSGQVRQHHSGSISESARGYKVNEADGTGHEHINNSGKEFSIIISNTSEGIIKHDSRFSEQTKNVKYRDGNIRQDVQKIDHTVGSTTSRYVRNQAKHKMQKILLPESKRRSRSGRCAKSELDIRQGVRISTNTASATSITQVIKDQDSSNYGSPGLASKKLVSTTTKDEAGGSNKDSGQGSTSSGIKKNWKLYSKSKPVSLAFERSPLRKKGVSERVISTLLDCRKKVTRKIYLKYWKTFNMWQEESGFKGDLVPTILEFLQDWVEKNISLSTLKVQVAAISTFMDERLARDPLIIQFFKSVERKKPMLKKKVHSWDLSLVLKVLKKEPFEPIADISFRLLTMKTVFLIAITSARRVSELEALCCDEPFCIILRDEVILKTCDEFLPKSYYKISQIPGHCATII
ncbi:uncharacterized protein [Hyperolius riggenbachi]|uniref:uncharacterized protein n=1 Tax=Hyperolius riggenbachi TaxID=752182 RepID=UPI0035A327E5